MEMRVSVWTRDLRRAEAAFVKGVARLVFEAGPKRSWVLWRAANVAEEFDLDIYVDSKLTDPYEIRDELEREKHESKSV